MAPWLSWIQISIALSIAEYIAACVAVVKTVCMIDFRCHFMRCGVCSSKFISTDEQMVILSTMRCGSSGHVELTERMIHSP